jgi:hypothetical protein
LSNERVRLDYFHARGRSRLLNKRGRLSNEKVRLANFHAGAKAKVEKSRSLNKYSLEDQGQG